MKIKIDGNVHCLKCAWEGNQSELQNENNGETLKCPDCNQVLIDTHDGNFIMQFVKADTLEVTD